MDRLSDIVEKARQDFDLRTHARDRVLGQARQLTRHAANAIRAIHRMETDLAEEHLKEAREIMAAMKSELAGLPDLFFQGYTQDAIKELCEAHITYALIRNQPLPSPEELGVETATYFNGLAEVPGELRRRCLDILRLGFNGDAERLLDCMDEIYITLVTMDYPDAITNGLRRQTDLVRGILERTRGDLTISMRQDQLKQSLEGLMGRMPKEG